ncbi:MAG: aminotransferase class V-fold PLP-dependent enzyme [Armatimonadota bacterium]
MAVYLDCAATPPIDPRVLERVVACFREEVGNAGSRTHEYGARARRVVEQARDQVAAAVGAARGEIVFTSGATESNNLAILGLAEHGRWAGRRHLVSTQVEHRAVLEPLQALARSGFELTLVPPDPGGRVAPEAVRAAVRPETLLVSVMQVNNETGIRQPVGEIAELLGDHPAYLHVDAAQGFGLEPETLRHARIDLVSLSGHKAYGPKGIGALVARRRSGKRPPLEPLLLGGGQELGLRPGTLPVPLIAGLGLAAELAAAEALQRRERCRRFGERLLQALAPLASEVTGDPVHRAPHILNLGFPGLPAEETIEALGEVVAVSDGAACSSGSETCSHVLAAMGLPPDRAECAVRWSWCHLTEEPDWDRIVRVLDELRSSAREG